jgi:hypothetical protein
VPNSVIGVGLVRRIGGKMVAKIDRAELEEDQRDADREGQIADAVDDERLDRRGAGGRRSYQ